MTNLAPAFVHPNITMEQMRQILTKAESNTSPLAQYVQATLKLFKQRSSFFNWNPGTRVFHRQFNKTVHHYCSESNETGMNKLGGVSTKIEHDLLQAQAIRCDNQILWTVHGNADAAVSLVENTTHWLQDIFQDIRRSQLDFELVGSSAVHVQQTSEKVVNETKTRTDYLSILLQCCFELII
jgi:hypothetical protein